MALPARKRKMTPSEFVTWENEQSTRHEYVAGEVFAMTGGRRVHAKVIGNVHDLLHAHLRGSPCEVFMSDLKLEVKAAKAVFYPDLLVTCHPDDLKAEYVVHHPRVVIEVLSETTAAYDRGQKFETYRLLDSLEEYVLVDPDVKSVDLYRRERSGDWKLATRDAKKGLILPSLKFRAPLAAVFEGA